MKDWGRAALEDCMVVGRKVSWFKRKRVLVTSEIPAFLPKHEIWILHQSSPLHTSHIIVMLAFSFRNSHIMSWFVCIGDLSP
jgi:hypothetical protein